MKDLAVTIIQANLHWENIADNLAMFAEKLNAIVTKTDVIILPEMFNTGFSMQSEKLAETMNGKTVSWIKEQAKKKDAVIVGSLIITEDNNYYNRLIWAQPNGTIYTYNKRHLFRMGNEHHYFTAGTKRLIINHKGWKICPLICYDLRFPIWSRNIELKVKSLKLKPRTSNLELQPSNQYDLLIYIANWPTSRADHWRKLLEARAIENQCYVVGVNRIGIDGKDNNYSGNSAIIDAKGNKISTTLPHQETTETITLSMTNLNAYREKFPAFKDADNFNMN